MRLTASGKRLTEIIIEERTVKAREIIVFYRLPLAAITYGINPVPDSPYTAGCRMR